MTGSVKHDQIWWVICFIALWHKQEEDAVLSVQTELKPKKKQQVQSNDM